MEEKYVYVIYNPLYEKVICVHDEPGKTCNLCESYESDSGIYPLEEYKYLIQTKLK